MTVENVKILKACVKKADIPKVYRSIAPIYDIWGMLTETKARKRCLELAKIQDGEKVLEVAVGTGSAFVEILKKNPHGWNAGMDLTVEMLNRARKKAEKLGIGNYSLEPGDAYDLPYPAEEFDVVLNNYMFDLLPEQDFPMILGGFFRVLRPGGRLVMANMTKPLHWYNALSELVYRIRPSLLGGCRGVYLLPYLESAGFIDTQREYVSQMTFPTEVIRGLKPKAV
ncbi:MAG: methyltransferase domain-containing protein [Desulfomonilia bacterium]|jgi:ubiquinone/menaquinone biosynthesis C-methylase UbiE